MSAADAVVSARVFAPKLRCWVIGALLLAPMTPRATVTVTATLPQASAPFSNAATVGMASSLTVTVKNGGTQAAHRVDFVLPTGGYTAPGGTPPTGWTLSNISGGVRFTTACSNAGIAPGASVTFVINFTTPLLAVTGDSQTGNFTVTGRTGGSGGGCPMPASNGSITFTAPLKALALTGSAAPAHLLGTPLSGTLTWTVTNESTTPQTGVTVSPVVVTPSSGATGSCTTLASLGSRSSGTVTCTYTFTAAGTYSFAANAQNTSLSATAVGATATGTIAVGSSNVAWSKSVIASGRPAYTLAMTVNNVSATTVTRIDVTNASASGWTLGSASATNGLSLAAGSTAADVAFTGTLAAGASSSLNITFSAVPVAPAFTTTTPFPFGVKLTPAEGAAYAFPTSHTVVLVVPISDVAGLTALANSSGQTLAWTNTSANGSNHDGVVIFRAPTGTTPASPVDFTVYSAGTGGVIYADPGGSTTSSFIDGTVGNFNYRVCNRDAYYVYSACNSGFESGQGWLDAEAFPTGGWVHAIGGDARLRSVLPPGGRIGLASNAASVTVLDLATGQRSFAPYPLPSLPSINTPYTVLENGRTALFAADQGGNLTAVDLASGGLYWQVTKLGESFTAGVSGVTRSFASADFQAAYPMDILLIGSTSGHVYAIDATTGNTLWTLAVGAGVYGLVTYDPIANIFWVPTNGAGVKAYTLEGSSPTVAAPPAPSWNNPEPAGLYRVNCTRTAGSAGIACVNTGGVLRIMNKTTGALQATAFSTSVSSPAALVRVSGTAATPGLVVSNSTTAQVLSASGTPYTIASIGIYSGAGLSTPAVYADSGFFVVGGNDRRLHRVSLANAKETASSAQVSTQAPVLTLAQPVFDAANSRYLFGTSDGHLWAIPAF